MKIRTITLLAGLAATSAAHAEAEFDPGYPPTLTISANITKADADYVELIKQTNSWWVYLIDSLGGDVDAAIKIGRAVREHESLVQVPVGTECFSSCALIYIAGTTRKNRGVIGLHRPFLGTSLSREAVERVVPMMLQKVKDYVQEMGVSDAFYDAMVNTEVDGARLYRGNEIKNLVPETDPTYDEVENSYEARRYGISAAEMRRRKSLVNRRCTAFDERRALNCRDAVFWGIDLATYEGVILKLQFPQCRLTDEQTQTYQNTDFKTRRDLPFIVALEKCRQEAIKQALGR